MQAAPTPRQQEAFDGALAQGVPPDLVLAGPLVSEVSHQGLILLDTSGPAAVLRHRLSGERHDFHQGQASLHFHEKRAFVQVEGETVWANKHLRTSVWECVADRRQFLVTKREDGHDAQWLSELQQRHQPRQVQLDLSATRKNIAVDVQYFFHRHSAGLPRIFWNLESAKTGLSFVGVCEKQQQRWVAHGLDSSWNKVLRGVGCTADDQLNFTGRNGRAAVGGGGGGGHARRATHLHEGTGLFVGALGQDDAT